MIYISETTPGAPGLVSGIGVLASVLDWALPQAGWTVLFSSGDERVYRTVNGLLLYLNDDNAQFATVRGVESASSASAHVDPFPSVALAPISVWRKHNGTGPTNPRPFDLLIHDDFLSVVLFYGAGGRSDASAELGAFGQPLLSYPGDAYGVVMISRKSTSGSTSSDTISAANVTSALANFGHNNLTWMRDISGAVKSSSGKFYASSNGNFGSVLGAPVARAGYLNQVVREPLGLDDSGSQGTTAAPLALSRRGFFPNFWAAVHSNPGTLTSDDTFTDAGYNPAALFKPVIGASNRWVIQEVTDTWNIS